MTSCRYWSPIVRGLILAALVLALAVLLAAGCKKKGLQPPKQQISAQEMQKHMEEAVRSGGQPVGPAGAGGGAAGGN